MLRFSEVYALKHAVLSIPDCPSMLRFMELNAAENAVCPSMLRFLWTFDQNYKCNYLIINSDILEANGHF